MENERARAWALMKDLDFCMLVTQPAAGMRARPMSSIVKQDEGRIYFLTDATAAKDEEIVANRNILLAYGDGKAKFVSTRATAMISNDRALVRRLWNPGAQAFWPQGPEDPMIVTIVATPSDAQYWDGPGAVLRAVRFAAALATGRSADMGEEAKVKL